MSPRRFLSLLALVVAIMHDLPAQHLFPISIEGNWGYIDSQGKLLIEPTFLGAAPFSEGLAVVAVAGQSEEDRVFERVYSGFIDATGKFAIPAKPPDRIREMESYDRYSFSDFHEGLAKVHVNDATGVGGYIDRGGNVVIAPQFSTAGDFSEGLAFVSTRRPWSDAPHRTGFIDRSGEFVIENNAFQYSTGFSAGRAYVSVKSGNQRLPQLIDREGNVVIPPDRYDSISNPGNGAFRVTKDGLVGLVDRDGKTLVALGKYDQILAPEDGNVFVAKRKEKFHLIHADGKQLGEVSVPGAVGRFEGGMAAIIVEEKIGFINESGQMIIAPKFDSVRHFQNGLALVQTGHTKGYINTSGDFVWKTDRWDTPLRNSVTKELSEFLPEGLIEAKPLSYNWEKVNNAIVFAAEGDVAEIQEWYKSKFEDKYEFSNQTDFDSEPGKLDFYISRPESPSLEIFVIDGTQESADGFVRFYSCKNMDHLRSKYPKKVIGIVIEN